MSIFHTIQAFPLIKARAAFYPISAAPFSLCNLCWEVESAPRAGGCVVSISLPFLFWKLFPTNQHSYKGFSKEKRITGRRSKEKGWIRKNLGHNLEQFSSHICMPTWKGKFTPFGEQKEIVLLGWVSPGEVCGSPHSSFQAEIPSWVY